jgi:hypothetical protein
VLAGREDSDLCEFGNVSRREKKKIVNPFITPTELDESQNILNLRGLLAERLQKKTPQQIIITPQTFPDSFFGRCWPPSEDRCPLLANQGLEDM